MAMDASAMTVTFSELAGVMAQTAACLLAGALIGLVHFLSLRSNARCLVEGRVALSLVLQLARFAVTAAGLGLMALRFGALPLLEGTLGLMIVRSAVLRRELR
jgi:N-ATPase, AtpR subunit